MEKEDKEEEDGEEGLAVMGLGFERRRLDLRPASTPPPCQKGRTYDPRQKGCVVLTTLSPSARLLR